MAGVAVEKTLLDAVRSRGINISEARMEKDIKRVAGLVEWHLSGRRAKATRGIKDEWALIRFATVAFAIIDCIGGADAG